jgi:hypothetical protein
MNIEALLQMPASFTAEQYLFWTRIQCLAWTAADLVIVYYVLRLANLARETMGQRKHVFSYAALAGTAFFAPLVFLARDGWTMFLTELAITVPHFLLILYAGAANLRLLPAFLAVIIARSPQESSKQQV